MNENNILAIDTKKINKTIVISMWAIIITGTLAYTISMILQKKEISFIINNLIIFVSLSSFLALVATLAGILLKKKKIVQKYILVTNFILILPTYAYITRHTNPEVLVISYIALLLTLLYMDTKLLIYGSSLIFVLNAVLMIIFKELIPKEHGVSVVFVRLFTLTISIFLLFYLSTIIQKIFKVATEHEFDITEDKISAVKTLSVVKELSVIFKDLSDSNYKISIDLTKSSEIQASSVEEIAASTEELMASIEEISKNTVISSESMKNVVDEVQVGMSALKESSEEMLTLVKLSKIMIESVEMINDVAENTNMLALNASIEAARAGEAGKGFVVVATEIRKLAEKSTLAAQNVGELLVDSKTKITNGANLNNKVNEIFSDISDKLGTISKIFQHISLATQEISRGGKEISNGIETINQSASTNLELAKNIENTNDKFSNESKKLHQILKANRNLGIDLVRENK